MNEPEHGPSRTKRKLDVEKSRKSEKSGGKRLKMTDITEKEENSKIAEAGTAEKAKAVEHDVPDGAYFTPPLFLQR